MARWIFLSSSVACALWATSLRGQEKPQALYIMKVDGSQARKLPQVDGYSDHESPRWSRDGKRIVFHATSAQTRTNDLFVVNADGTGLEKIGSGQDGDWSPDDKQIALDAAGAVFVQNVNGQARDRVAGGRSPRWSPDGSQMAVSEGGMLHVIDLVTGEQRSLFGESFTTLFGGFCWSPDGKNIAVIVHQASGPRRQLLVVNSQGAEHGLKVRVQTEGGMSGWVTYSPDGKQLAYSAAYLILVADVEGTARPRILPDQKGKNFEPDWSPDGQWFVFTSDRE